MQNFELGIERRARFVLVSRKIGRDNPFAVRDVRLPRVPPEITKVGGSGIRV